MMLPTSMCRPTGVRLAEVRSGEELAHHGDGQRSLAIAFRDFPSLQQRNLHGREESRPRDTGCACPARRHAVDRDWVRSAGPDERSMRQRRVADAGNLAEAAPQIGIESRDPGLRIAGLRRIQLEQQHALAIEARAESTGDSTASARRGRRRPATTARSRSAPRPAPASGSGEGSCHADAPAAR